MEEVSDSDDFNLVEGKMDLVISDIVLLSKKEKAPDKYIAIEPPLAEGGRLSFTKRYIAYCREIPNQRWGRVVVSDIKVLSNNQPPVGYRGLPETHDDVSKSFGSKLIAIKLTPQEEAAEGVTDILVLSGSRKDQVPPGYKRLPEINGFSVCFQVTKLARREGPPPVTNRPRSGAGIVQPQDNKGANYPTYERQVSRKARSAVDGLSFKVNEDNSSRASEFLSANLKYLSLDDIETKFKFDWSLEEQAQAQT